MSYLNLLPQEILEEVLMYVPGSKISQLPLRRMEEVYRRKLSVLLGKYVSYESVLIQLEDCLPFRARIILKPNTLMTTLRENKRSDILVKTRRRGRVDYYIMHEKKAYDIKSHIVRVIPDDDVPKLNIEDFMEYFSEPCMVFAKRPTF